MYFLGFDIGSSSIKVSLLNGDTSECVASAFFPKEEMKINSPQSDWAEQDPDLWWSNLKLALIDVLNKSGVKKEDIKGIGISYQMHGLVAIDKDKNVLRPSIIWCDSRAVETGNTALQEIGETQCLEHFLNSPGNFTASKLAWVKQYEPEIFNKIDKIMLPGDYIAMRLTGEINTTISGLSEGILWDFKNNSSAGLLLDHYGIDHSLLPDLAPTFSEQGILTSAAAEELGLAEGTPVTYRAGDQPNNAFSLNVLNPGEVAATAGTSGVVYGISDQITYDPKSRVNTFAHVNYSIEDPRLGVLLCVNGTGILNSWTKRMAGTDLSYEMMNKEAEKVNAGSEGLSVLPFGNGAERLLENKNIGAQICNLNFNIHSKTHLFRAVQEGIVFAFKYGLGIMEKTGINPKIIRAGHANMFLSPIFRQTLADITGARIELYNTDGAQGAATGAALGSGFYKSSGEAFEKLEHIHTIEPEKNNTGINQAFQTWIDQLDKYIK